MVSLQLPADILSFFLLAIGLLGLLVGSFLNVVILRLPIMLQNAWQAETIPITPQPAFNLCFPTSHCPRCQHKIAWFDNIPCLSYIYLRGLCRHCRQKISVRYPMVECLTALLSVIVALQFGVTWTTLAGLIFTWILVAITFIDIDHTLIPDDLTLPSLWLGLFISLFEVFQTPSSAILGTISGYLILWSVYWIFKGCTGKEGMGYGDFKLLAMLGAWLGWQALPLIILSSSCLGTLVGISLILFRKQDKNIPIPFGPFLAIGGFIALVWGPYLNQQYLEFHWLGL